MLRRERRDLSRLGDTNNKMHLSKRSLCHVSHTSVTISEMRRENFKDRKVTILSNITESSRKTAMGGNDAWIWRLGHCWPCRANSLFCWMLTSPCRVLQRRHMTCNSEAPVYPEVTKERKEEEKKGQRKGGGGGENS